MAKKTTTPSTTDEHSHDHDHSHDHNHDHHGHDVPLHPSLSQGRMIDFTIPWETVQVALEKVIQKYQPHVKTDGFRKGKVPAKIVKDMVGEQQLFQEAAEQIVPKAYVDAIKAQDAKPLSDPEIHIVEMKDGQDWKFHAHIAEYPEVELGDYKKEVKKALKEVADELKKEAKKDDKALTPEETEKLEAKRKDNQINKVLSTLLQTINPKVPELLIRQEVTRQLQQLERQLKMLNIEVEKYLSSVGKTVEDLQQEYAAQALATWQAEFILDTIANTEKIDVTDEEVSEVVLKSKEQVSPEQQEDQKSQVKYGLRKQKVLEHLLAL